MTTGHRKPNMVGNDLEANIPYYCEDWKNQGTYTKYEL